MKQKVQFEVYVYESEEQKQAAIDDSFAFLKFCDLFVTNGLAKAQELARKHQHAIILKQRYGGLEWFEYVSY